MGISPASFPDFLRGFPSSILLEEEPDDSIVLVPICLTAEVEFSFYARPLSLSGGRQGPLPREALHPTLGGLGGLAQE